LALKHFLAAIVGVILRFRIADSEILTGRQWFVDIRSEIAGAVERRSAVDCRPGFRRGSISQVCGFLVDPKILEHEGRRQGEMEEEQ
jgi:hypothetical protein